MRLCTRSLIGLRRHLLLKLFATLKFNEAITLFSRIVDFLGFGFGVVLFLIAGDLGPFDPETAPRVSAWWSRRTKVWVPTG